MPYGPATILLRCFIYGTTTLSDRCHTVFLHIAYRCLCPIILVRGRRTNCEAQLRQAVAERTNCDPYPYSTPCTSARVREKKPQGLTLSSFCRVSVASVTLWNVASFTEIFDKIFCRTRDVSLSSSKLLRCPWTRRRSIAPYVHSLNTPCSASVAKSLSNLNEFRHC